MLIAFTGNGGAETSEITFAGLDMPDQFGFIAATRLQSPVPGNCYYFLHFHDALLADVINGPVLKIA